MYQVVLSSLQSQKLLLHGLQNVYEINESRSTRRTCAVIDVAG